MTSRLRSRRASWAVLGLVLGLPTAVRGDGLSGDERRYAREQLLTEARAVESVASEDASLEPLREALSADAEALKARRADPRPATPEERALLDELALLVTQRDRLMGHATPDAPEVVADGALGQARWLLRWLKGKEPCAVLVSKKGAATGVAYPYPMPKEVTAPATTPKAPAPPSPAPPGPAPSAPAAPGPTAPAAPQAAAAPAPTPGPTEVPTPPPSEVEKDPWTPWVQWVASKEGSLAAKSLASGPCGNLSDLGAVAREDVAEGRGTAFAGNLYDLNEAVLRLRARQAKERVEAYGKEVPTPGLVEESTVREKTRRASERADEVKALEKQRADLASLLDELAARVAKARVEASDLAGQIDEAKRAELPAPTVPPTAAGAAGEPRPAVPVSLPVRVLEAREARNTLRLRLLYLGALWADARSQLLDEAIRLAQGEARAADLARARFADELDRVRRERQVDRLEWERTSLRSGLSVAEQQAKAAVERGDAPAQRAQAESFAEATRAVLAAHDVAREAVAAYRAAGARAEGRPAGPAAPPAGSPADDLLPYRSPSPADLDPTYVEGALARVGTFDRATVARNFQAAARRSAALRATTSSAKAVDGYRERFRLAAAEAETRIAAWSANLPSWAKGRVETMRTALAGAHDDLEDAVRGLDAERLRNRETLDALVRFQDALLEQGERSLSIRVDPEAGTGSLARGVSSFTDGTERALRWVSFQGDDHLGTFVASHTGAVALLAVLCAVLYFGGERLRARLSTRIDRLALRVPGIRTEGANVEEERRDEKSRDAHAEAAIEAKADELLRQAAGEETAEEGDAEATDARPGPPPDARAAASASPPEAR